MMARRTARFTSALFTARLFTARLTTALFTARLFTARLTTALFTARLFTARLTTAFLTTRLFTARLAPALLTAFRALFSSLRPSRISRERPRATLPPHIGQRISSTFIVVRGPRFMTILFDVASRRGPSASGHDRRCSSFLTASGCPGTSSVDQHYWSAVLRASDGNRAR